MKEGTLNRSEIMDIFADLRDRRGAESALGTCVVYLANAMGQLPTAKRRMLSDMLLQLHEKSDGYSSVRLS